MLTPRQLSVLLISRRKAVRLTQQALGARMDLSQSRLSVLEKHPERLTVDQLLRWLTILDLELQLTTRGASAAAPAGAGAGAEW
jgi:HTH-type transcriptional regulator/antitoxin HipB